MGSSNLPRDADSTSTDAIRFQRLRQTRTFRSGGFARWSRARLAVIGAGLLGSHLAEEAVLSGASVSVFDPDIGELGNLGTQRCRVGQPKAEALVERCDVLRPGCARAYTCDVRHAGVRPLLECDPRKRERVSGVFQRSPLP